ncbi:SDR family NAD(P)-dependent oxidoreductase [Mycobacterium neumannii]|uniref:SDR family NAD(P)-dependent oxidoreductase n=1 Tax=Mycobacterium neumannii TaxID=2048551 RepID=UPI003AB5EDE0
MSTTPLAGRRALVTGGSRGIGAEIVRRLASDGAAVAFTYSASATDAEKLVAHVADRGGRAVAIQADAADPAQVAAAVDQSVADLGGLDVLVNNAGVAHLASIDDFPAEQFDRLVATNIGGMFWAVRTAMKYLVATAVRGVRLRVHHHPAHHRRRRSRTACARTDLDERAGPRPPRALRRRAGAAGPLLAAVIHVWHQRVVND